MRRQIAPASAIAPLATAQGGVVSRAQVVDLGLSTQAIDRRVRAQQLLLLHRGVYAVGHRTVGPDGRWMAAVLALGGDAVLSHESAAAAWGLRRGDGGAIHVTVSRGGRARRPGLVVHRSGTLTPAQMTTRGGIPVSTPGRAVLDLAAAGLRGRRLERLLDRAEALVLDFGDVHEVLRTHPRRPGATALAELLSRHTPGTIVTRSEMEERFLEVCDRHAIPRPRVNTRVAGFEVDFAWRAERLAVEVDGYAFHRSRGAFEDDRARDVALVLAGFRVLRFTWAQLTRRPGYVPRALRTALSGRRAP
jgi:very-short-patch-repair endonuclease